MHSNRRKCLQTMLALGAGAGIQAAWPSRLAAKMKSSGKGRRLIVLWMPGGPSQMDTFDLKPGHENGGTFKEIQTTVPGMRFSEHLPGLAQHAEHLALIRGMQTKEGDHSRGTFLIRTGQRPGAPVPYPAIPAALANELTSGDASVPGYVSILPNSFINPSAFGAGFLGASREPLTVGGTPTFDPAQFQLGDNSDSRMAELKVNNLLPPDGLDDGRLKQRREFWELLQQSYGAPRRSGPAATHDTVYRRAMQLAESKLVDAFDLSRESEATRERYGTDNFGQGCLMARRLIERDVPVVEISLNDGPGGLSWDSHTDNFNIVRGLSQRLDRSWSQLMVDLASTGLLEQTTLVWMGEFGRTPKINSEGGRDHFPNAWTCVLGGAGIQGGSIVGKTSQGGEEVVDRPVQAADFLATLCQAVGVDPETENMSDDRRPIKLVEGTPIREILA